MIQGKSHHAESRAKTRKASAAQNRIQGKTTAGLLRAFGNAGPAALPQPFCRNQVLCLPCAGGSATVAPPTNLSQTYGAVR
jgi:hypothetical protein